MCHHGPKDLFGGRSAVCCEPADHCRPQECTCIEGSAEFRSDAAREDLSTLFLRQRDVALDLVSMFGGDQGAEVRLRIRRIPHHHLRDRLNVAVLEGFKDAALNKQA